MRKRAVGRQFFADFQESGKDSRPTNFIIRLAVFKGWLGRVTNFKPQIALSKNIPFLSNYSDVSNDI